ncbi:MAG TPA: hypothetical protein VMV49_18615 [Candidatus Deferrimicrobium sp.]|nr:hypothetical protein [Candidatus Deferrimicrobium sp.]
MIKFPEIITNDFTFPITGPLREILLGFEWLIVFFCLQFAIIFLRRGFQFRREKKEILRNQDFKTDYYSHKKLLLIPKEFAWTFFFIGFGVMEIFYIFGDFYIDPSFRMEILFMGYLSAMITFWIFTFIIEYTEYRKSSHIFTKLFLILIIVVILLMIFAPNIVQTATFVIWIPVIFMLLLYLTSLYKLSKFNPKILLNTLILFVALGFLSIGFLGTTDLMMTHLGIISRLVGDIFQNVGLLVLGFTFHILPSFEEYEWKDALQELYVIDEAGRTLYFHQFKPLAKIEETDQLIVSSALTSVKLFLQEMTQKGEKLKLITVKGKSLMVAHGNFISCVIFVNKFLYNLQIKQQNFVKRFEDTYSHILKEWTGETTVFNSTAFIIDEMFS